MKTKINDIANALETRQRMQDSISELQFAKAAHEREITKYLISNEMDEFFSINWAKLQRAMR